MGRVVTGIVCRYCNSRNVRRSRSHLRGWWRWFMGIHTYYCPDCHHRWGRKPTRGDLIWRFMYRAAVPISFLVLAGLLSLHPGDPKQWIKSRIIDTYQLIYGNKHKIMLHQHLGWLYPGGVGAEIEDYKTHRDEDNVYRDL